MADAIPVFDLRDFTASEFIKACEEWGCFRIVNFESILPVSLMQEMKKVVASLLELPLEIKQRNVDAIAGSGYRSPGLINPIHEGLGLYDIASDQAVDAFCTQLEATPHQRETITRYAQAVHELIKDMGRKIGQGLGLNEVPFENWPCQFRINKYPFTPENIGSDGLRTHTDNGFLTVVQDDEQFAGLEVMQKSGNFVPVDPSPGTLLVNFGDIATVWSNGRFYNVKHKVVCKEEGIRISIATFLLGPKEAMVEAPPELVTLENPRLYVPFKFEDFRNTRVFKHLNAGEALDHFLLKP
ncbi:hypothetical protein ACJIZ3_014801 [Penstemon smallii]|uniref:2-oxoglutarate-dependent dioxygenase DAO n=1 Tax=Penstemon smallii TaxID=265156 RepID=A0ABD3RKW4_9LAMI